MVLCLVTDALRSGKSAEDPVLWTQKMNASFLPFKQDLADSTVLSHQLYGAAFSLQVNASALLHRGRTGDSDQWSKNPKCAQKGSKKRKAFFYKRVLEFN